MKRNLIRLAALAAILLLFGGCGRQPQYAEHSFFAMDTLITLRISRRTADGDELDDVRMNAIFAQAEQFVQAAERVLSRTLADSDTARLNESDAGISCTDGMLPAVMTRALEIADATGGAFSPAMGRLTDLWNISGGGPVPSPEKIREALAHTDFRALSVDGMCILKSDPSLCADLGAVAKGWTAGQLCKKLSESGAAWGIVSLGGNVGVFGDKPDGNAYKIGISDPDASGEIIGYLLIKRGTVAVSGDYERFFEENGVRYHHIIDSADGMPADSGLRSTAVFSEDGALADALSTALFVMGAERALAYYDAHPGTFEAILITDESEVILTPGLVLGDDFTLNGEKYRVQT